jgi:hypothetical protein
MAQEAICALTPEVARTDRRRKYRDPLKTRIADIKAMAPRISQATICSKVDSIGIELHERWRQSGNRTWSHAFRDEKLKGPLKTYFSKIKP